MGDKVGLLTQVRVSDASVCDELHQHESELIGNELVVRQTRLPTQPEDKQKSLSSELCFSETAPELPESYPEVPLPKAAPSPDPGSTIKQE